MFNFSAFEFINNYLSLMIIAFAKTNLPAFELGYCIILQERGSEMRKYAYCYEELSSQLIIYGIVSFVSIIAFVNFIVTTHLVFTQVILSIFKTEEIR